MNKDLETQIHETARAIVVQLSNSVNFKVNYSE